MDVRDYLRFMRRRWTLIVGCTAVVVVLATVLTLRSTPIYQSESRVFVQTSGSKTADSSDTAYQGGLAATQRVKSYASLVTDGELAQRVVTELKLKTTPAQLSKQLSADVVPDTVLLRVGVKDPSAARAQAICRAVVSELLTMISEIETPPGDTTPLLKGTVVGPATKPLQPVSPKPARNIMLALAVGLLLGIALARLRETLDRSIERAEDVADALGTSVLGGISNDPETAKHPLVTHLGSHAPRVEAFRVLRTNLQFVDVDSRNKVFVVTSSVPGEGKSTTAVNVAITMAQAGQRVLLVDGDLRRPQVANMLGLTGEVGVTTVLLGRIGLDDAIQSHRESGLSILASGAVPPNPAELLQSKAMSELLEIVRAEYDVVVIDSPPLLPVTDAALLARQTDGAVVVVRHGKTTRDQLEGARGRLEGVDARILGAVFNRVHSRGGTYGYGYGEGYGYAPDDDVVQLASAEADLAPRRDHGSSDVAEVLPIRRTVSSGHHFPEESDHPRGWRQPPQGRTPERLEDTGTTGPRRPGRHRS